MMDILWTNEDCTALGWQASTPWQATGVSIDTRTLQSGDLYVALKGANFDGNDFMEEAFRKGAVAAIGQNAIPGKPIVLVQDSLKALEQLAVRARQRTNAHLIAITGSVGKTGTKEMLRSMLSASGTCHAATQSFNNHIGVPLTLARMPQDADYAVFEIGTNHPGEIAPLAQLVKPHVALITTIEPVHTEHFTGPEAIADEKNQITSGLDNNGIVILPRDNPHFERLQKQTAQKILTFGKSTDTDAQLKNIELHDSHSIVQAKILGTDYQYKLSIPGEHIALNSLAALLGVQALGGDLAKAMNVLANIQPYAGRGARNKLSNGTIQIEIIDESYNASPPAVRAALKVLSHAKGRRIACLGDMLELGNQSAALHRDLLKSLQENKIDLVFTCGAFMQNLASVLPPIMQGGHYDNSSQMGDDILHHIKDGDVVLIKGSAGMKMKLVLEKFLATMTER